MAKDEHRMHRAHNAEFEKRLPCFGDASAVALTKFVSDKPIADADMPAILAVLGDSYDFSASIEDATERQRRTILYLLHSLSHETRDPKNICAISVFGFPNLAHLDSVI
jgi:hypothetical protein